ncbi:MAG: hypothetical protein EPO09_07240 [Aquabacterium sp.]|uniref:DUF5666 domain-containing protein n=1 Tax=Aquabacterium sp. TaxID=1872578 RepID=UPI0011FEDDE9|nr:DUF5666 domain-containing protein [Aquabacterium sp.]TAK95828.1 MAG: hypothetical protein EPO09_07240 [Aquabacterium sp.]
MKYSSPTLFKLGSIAAALASILTLVACGGGGSSSDSTASSGSGASTASYSGAVSGLGSVIVNGVRFSTTGADTADSDSPDQPFVRPIGLGSTVTVTGSVNADGTTGTASTITVHGGVRGQVTAIASSTFTVAGQVITVDSNTVWDGSTANFNLSALQANVTYVEVYGVVDASGNFTATRVEQLTAAPTEFAIKGLVANLDTTGHSFDLALRSGVTAHVSYADNIVKPAAANLVAGADVRVLLGSSAITSINGTSSGTVNVTADKVLVKKERQANGMPSKLQGAITVVTAGTTWKIGDVTIDISQSPTVEDGLNLSTITTGTIVKVKGSFSNGVLVAQEVEADNHERTQTDGGVKLFGAVSASDSNAQTFVVQGVTVTMSNTTVGSLPAVGAYVEVLARPLGTPAVLTAIAVNTPQAGPTPRRFELYGSAPCTAGTSDLSGTFTLTLRDGSLTVDGSAATISTGRNVDMTVSNTPLNCLVEVKGSMSTVNNVRTLSATTIEVKKRAASVSLR